MKKIIGLVLISGGLLLSSLVCSAPQDIKREQLNRAIKKATERPVSKDVLEKKLRKTKNPVYKNGKYAGGDLSSSFCQEHPIACTKGNAWCATHECSLTIKQYCAESPSYHDCKKK